jgi:hypothetical protein
MHIINGETYRRKLSLNILKYYSRNFLDREEPRRLQSGRPVNWQWNLRPPEEEEEEARWLTAISRFLAV